MWYSSKESSVASMLVALRVVHATSELSEDVLDACVKLAHVTMRSVLNGIDHAERVRLFTFY